MTANIAMLGNVASMAYVGEKPWHGLGQELTAGAPLEVWASEARMEWRVLRSKVRYETDHDGSAPRVWSDKHVLFRSDTKAPLGVVSDRYKIVQPLEVLSFFTDVAKVNGLRLETAGCLNEGRVYWALAKTSHEASLGGVDPMAGYVLLATSADGTMATTGKFTNVRVVCSNTIAMALSDGKEAIKVRHSTAFDANAVRIDLGLADATWAEFTQNAAMLASRPLSKREALAILIDAIGDADKFAKDLREAGSVEKAAESQEGFRGMASILDLFNGKALGSNLATAQGTAWGLVNAATQYYDHAAGRAQDSRLTSAWFGVNAGRKQSILKQALAVSV